MLIFFLILLGVIILIKFPRKISDEEVNVVTVNSKLPETLLNINKYQFNIHDDIRNLVWILDGPNKNYFPETEEKIIKIDENISIKVSFSFQQEPSAIKYNSSIKKIQNIASVDPPGYFPSFETLNPLQRYVYAIYLSNPYRTDLDIGYTFILHYGLERFILTDKYEEAFDVILKLREVHNNRSFKNYSLNALFFCCLIHKRNDLFLKLKNHLDKFEEVSNIYIFSKYVFNENLMPSELIEISRYVDFSNQRYINNNYDLFLETLNELMMDSLGINEFDLNHYDIRESKDTFQIILANYSLDMDLRLTEFPNIFSNQKLKQDIFNILQTTHNIVKAKLEAERRLGYELSKNEQAILLSTLTVEQLKDVLKDKQLILSGNKKDLIVRVLDNFSTEEIHKLFYN